MATQNNEQIIGEAWNMHRQGQNQQAIDKFEQVLRNDTSNVDALYGKALAQRAIGHRDASIESFEQAKESALSKLDKARKDRENSTNLLDTTDDDRYTMLIRMIGQRIAETRG